MERPCSLLECPYSTLHHIVQRRSLLFWHQVILRAAVRNCRVYRPQALLLFRAGEAPSPAGAGEEPGTILSANAYMLMYRRRGWQYSGSLASQPFSLPDRHVTTMLSDS